MTFHSTEQTDLISDAKRNIAVLERAIPLLSMQRTIEPSSAMFDRIAMWKMEREAMDHYGRVVTAQSDFTMVAQPLEEVALHTVTPATPSDEFNNILRAEGLNELRILREALKTVTENPFSTKVYTMNLPYGRCYVICQFNSVEKCPILFKCIYVGSVAFTDILKMAIVEKFA